MRHIHLWDLTQFPVPWIAGNPILDKSYVLQDYKDQSAGLGVGGIVYVQAAVANEYSLLEADYIADLAAHDSFVQGMVAYAPLEYGEQSRLYLDSLMTRGPIIKGIRRGLPDPADSKFDMDRFIQGIQVLPDYGLSFDILGADDAVGLIAERLYKNQRYRHRGGPHELDSCRPRALRGPCGVRLR